jgi:DNA-directed RNA polymerase subunit M/transcription elongation factor TFIIS
MPGSVDVLENFVAQKIVQPNFFQKHSNNNNNERQQNKGNRKQVKYQCYKCAQVLMVYVLLWIRFQDKTSRWHRCNGEYFRMN